MSKRSNNRPRPAPKAAPATNAFPLGLCFACVAEAKLADADERPVFAAEVLINGTGHCTGHVIVQRQSQLAAPNGTPLLVGG